jgi:hypothetical protein
VSDAKRGVAQRGLIAAATRAPVPDVGSGQPGRARIGGGDAGENGIAFGASSGTRILSQYLGQDSEGTSATIQGPAGSSVHTPVAETGSRQDAAD